METISITNLVENTAVRQGLRGEHGISFRIDTPHGSLLLDTGQSGLFIENAGMLGISMDSLEHIVLSHGHYDHTGGLFELLSRKPDCTITAHPDAFIDRFTPDGKNSGTARSIGIPFEKQQIKAMCKSLVLDSDPQKIVPGVYTTGQIPRETEYEDTGGAFFLDKNFTEKDPLHDDQSLVIETGKGLVVLLGCCHAGIINTLNFVSGRWKTREFALVAGGMHLVNASEERLEKTTAALKEFSIGELCPGHCTGWKAVCYLNAAFPRITQPLSVGWTWSG